MKNISKLMKQAQQMQSKITVLQNELEIREVEAQSGGGVVKVKVNGKQEIVEIKINPECIDSNDPEMLEELIKTAVNQAVKQSNEMVSSAMSKVTGGLKIPGLF